MDLVCFRTVLVRVGIGQGWAATTPPENGDEVIVKLPFGDAIELVPPGSQAHRPPTPVPTIDFSTDPEVVRVVAEGERLGYGHLFNPTFATEISMIDPLPHQRIAVYDHTLPQSPASGSSWATSRGRASLSATPTPESLAPTDGVTPSDHR